MTAKTRNRAEVGGMGGVSRTQVPTSPPPLTLQVGQLAAYSLSQQTSCLPHLGLERKAGRYRGEVEALHKTMALSQDKKDACSPLFMIVIGRNKALFMLPLGRLGGRAWLLSPTFPFCPTSSLDTSFPLTHRDQITFTERERYCLPLQFSTNTSN